jgi:Uncharacterized conserved protein (DUF2358)
MKTDILEILKQDYQNFPLDQTYEIYAEDVYFKDPMSQFVGRDRYKQTIAFMQTWFKNIQLNVHQIEQQGDAIETHWTLSWNTPLPWNPRISIPGRSELKLNTDGLIASHIDYWHCSRLAVLKQHFLVNS